MNLFIGVTLYINLLSHILIIYYHNESRTGKFDTIDCLTISISNI